MLVQSNYMQLYVNICVLSILASKYCFT